MCKQPGARPNLPERLSLILDAMDRLRVIQWEGLAGSSEGLDAVGPVGSIDSRAVLVACLLLPRYRNLQRA